MAICPDSVNVTTSVCLVTLQVQILPPTTDTLPGRLLRLCCCEWTRHLPPSLSVTPREAVCSYISQRECWLPFAAAAAACCYCRFCIYNSLFSPLLFSQILCSPSLLLLSCIHPCCSTSCSLQPSPNRRGSRGLRLEITFTWPALPSYLSHTDRCCCSCCCCCTDLCTHTYTHTHAQMHARAQLPSEE